MTDLLNFRDHFSEGLGDFARISISGLGLGADEAFDRFLLFALISGHIHSGSGLQLG